MVWATIIKILQRIALMSSITGALLLLGYTINHVVPWVWLTYFFVLLRQLLSIFSFMWDTNTLITLVAISFSVQVAIWAFKATMVVVAFFNEK